MSGPWDDYAPSKTVASADGPWNDFIPKTSAASSSSPSSGGFSRAIGNLLAGGLRGAGSIGATLMAPIDMVGDAMDGKGLSLESNRQRRKEMDTALGYMGADTKSNMFKVGKIGSEIAGTAGAGGALANATRSAIGSVAPNILANSPRLLQALESIGSGGFSTGSPVSTTIGGKVADLGIRTLGGAVNGGLSAGMVDPNEAGTGAVVGGLMPGAIKVAGMAGQGLSSLIDKSSNRLMQSAIKPTIAQLKSGDAATAVQTLLDYGINPTKGGVEKLRDKIGGLNDEIASMIGNSNATVSKQNVINSLSSVRQKFANQVSPTADLNAIQGVADDFAAHPNILGNSIPVQTAQDLKQGTYRILANKYGQLGSADTEAQKGLARGLKEEIANAVPGIQGLNAEESRLITTLNVSERRALMEMNKNPLGLATLAHDPVSFATFMADKSALFKSLAARMLNASSGGVKASGGLLEDSMRSNPLLRTSVPVISSSD